MPQQNQPGGPNDYVMQGQAWEAGQRARQPWNSQYANRFESSRIDDQRRAAKRRERRTFRRVVSGLWLVGEVVIFAVAGTTIKWVKTPTIHPSHGAGAAVFVTGVLLWTVICIAGAVSFRHHSRSRAADRT